MKIALLLALLIICQIATAQMPDSVRKYIDTALTVMQTRSLYAQGLDWKSIKDSVYYKARDAKKFTDAFMPLVYAFNQLKDKHGMIANEDTFHRYPAPPAALNEGIKKEYLKGPRIKTALLNNNIAYLKVPAMIGARQETIDYWANALRDSLCVLLSKNPSKLVLDLRMNNGGNIAPMLSGLGPLFARDTLGYGVDNNNRRVDSMVIIDGVASYHGKKMANVKTGCGLRRNLPTAVLVGPATASSGEILAALFLQQKNTRSFGEPTSGFLNATEGFLYMEQRGYLLLAVNRLADARNKIYSKEMITPDVRIKGQDNYDDLQQDPTVTAAMKWLKKITNKKQQIPNGR